MRNAEAPAAAPPQAVPTGNTYDKYGSTNPVVRRLMKGFDGALDELWADAAPESALDVGCGEGVLTERFASRIGTGHVVGVDLDDPKLREEWSRRTRENLEFRTLAGAGPKPHAAKDGQQTDEREALEV